MLVENFRSASFNEKFGLKFTESRVEIGIELNFFGSCG